MADDDILVLVDEYDNELGFAGKKTCHDSAGILHRAFSIFIFNSRAELLLTKRSPRKRLFGNLWTNTCCSHPRKGEDINVAVHRRLKEELGFDTDLRYIYKFEYQASFKD